MAKTAEADSVLQVRLAKIKLEDIRKAAIEHDWELVSTEYKNLKTPLEFKCEEGHLINLPYEKVRDKWECPICHSKHDRDTNASKNILFKGLSVA